MGQAAVVNLEQTAVVKSRRGAVVRPWQPAGHRILKQAEAAEASSRGTNHEWSVRSLEELFRNKSNTTGRELLPFSVDSIKEKVSVGG